MLLIDTHLHLYAEEFDIDRDTVVDSAIKAGVKKLILPNIDNSSLQGLDELAAKYPTICFPMMGLHPCYVKDNYKEELEIIRAKLFNGKYVGVGEIGMDKYWDLAHINEQEIALKIQLEWANELKLPVALHTRNCTQEVIDIVRDLKLPNAKGIFHCFGGTLDEAKQIIDLGFYLGIGGTVSFKNAGVDKIISEIDLKHIVLETDSPYLAPMPFRGKRNEPAYVVHIAEKISTIKNCSTAEVATITSENAQTLFGI
jgi:TatD DNase family protein